MNDQTNDQKLQGKHIVVGVCGSVAAYKSAEFCRLAIKQGASVTVVMSKAARQFITPLTFEALTGRRVWSEMFEGRGPESMPHIDLARSADLIVIAPASADLISRVATGRADDLMSCMLLANQAPVLIAPAMNPVMWASPITRENVKKLKETCEFGVVGPDSGEAACLESGAGRLADPAAILEAAIGFFRSDMAGLDVLITAGPTREAIDPVRYLSNHSSGKMGYALARCAERRAAKVTLISGPVAIDPPSGVHLISVSSAEQMHKEVTERSKTTDVLVMSAAVADYRVAKPSESKIKRTKDSMTLDLVPNPDILASVGNSRVGSKPLIVGFALETDKLLQSAKSKLERKGCDLLVANLAGQSIGLDASVAYILDSSGVIDEPGELPKDQLADRIWDRVLDKIGD